MTDQMGAEQVSPRQGEAQQTTQVRESRRQSLQLAAEGVSAGQNSYLQPQDEVLLPTQYNATTTDATGQPPFRPGGIPGTTPEQGQASEHHGGRRLLMAAGGAVVGVAALTAAYLGLNRSSGSEEQSPGIEPNGGAPTLVIPEKTESPSSTATASPTVEATQSPVKGDGGKYDSVEQLPLSDKKKEAIKELTKDTTPMIITDKGMIVIENDQLDREEKIQHNGKLVSADQLHSVKLNTQAFPNAEELFNESIERAKYDAWVSTSKNTTVSFEEYKKQAGNGQFPFEVRAFEGTSDTISYQNLSDTSYVIIKVLNDADRVTLNYSQAGDASFEVLDDVISLGQFTLNSTGIGKSNPNNGVDNSKVQFAVNLAGTLGGMSLDVPKNVIGRYVIGPSIETILDEINNIRTIFIPNGNNLLSEGKGAEVDSIFTVTGTPLK